MRRKPHAFTHGLAPLGVKEIKQLGGEAIAVVADVSEFDVPRLHTKYQKTKVLVETVR
ncbi:hypothetical protein H6G18_21245 [Anabaena subtropica FACHB-260]|uniref:Uncharacterized protein n=1 Tax=Anabaena subtropica FACHB-260 TaxID=2692884 RepID=A0ABR8CTY6_9NOST|nr:hypothetical protein [Anabaena subtropica FACHB-260]